ncbi:hypothetical protein [Parapedobacter sp. 2B3]|uniref:hypothetical protein n=1 Tax=Parapedobacter sp. 2B3 TaxID=3342381 RepID=UPI0035B62539
MDKRPKKELIDGVRDSLRNFEERYDRSEWEHFQQRRKKKCRKPVPLFVKLAGIAASLFLMVYASVRILPLLNLVEDHRKHVPTEVPQQREGPKEKEQGQPDSLAADSLVQPVGRYEQSEVSPLSVNGVNDDAVNRTKAKETVGRHMATQRHQKQRAARIQRIELKARLQTAGLSTVRDQNPGRLRQQSSPQRRIDLPEMDGLTANWPVISGIRVGANITPAFTNKGFSLGGGVSAQLPLSNRLSLEVGTSYMKVKVGQDMEADPADTVSLQRVGMRNAVGMVALPVALSYAISESFTVSAGLFPFRVVHGRHTDILLRYRWVNDGAASAESTGGRLIEERTRMQRVDSVYLGNTYIGFIQLSGQYHPPILKRRNPVLAPYVAIPLGRLRSDEYRWLHGGVSVRWYLR